MRVLFFDFQPYLVKVNRLAQREMKARRPIEEAALKNVSTNKIHWRRPPFGYVPILRLLAWREAAPLVTLHFALFAT